MPEVLAPGVAHSYATCACCGGETDAYTDGNRSCCHCPHCNADDCWDDERCALSPIPAQVTWVYRIRIPDAGVEDTWCFPTALVPGQRVTVHLPISEDHAIPCEGIVLSLQDVCSKILSVPNSDPEEDQPF